MRLVPVLAAVSIVVEDIGDIFSPTNAPDITAPAVIGSGMPKPSDTPINAKPTVPAVPHDVPVVRHVRTHTIKVSGRKKVGLIILIP